MPMRGTYQTRQQDAVAALFARQPDNCLTAEEAYRLLKDDGMDVGKTTVYRAIARLCELGQLRRYTAQARGEAARYQHNPCTESHLHIRCIHCGALAHLDCDAVDSFAQHLTRNHGFTLDEAQTMLYGVCTRCGATEFNENEDT